jgi:hypothetical protein
MDVSETGHTLAVFRNVIQSVDKIIEILCGKKLACNIGGDTGNNNQS